MMSLRDTGLDNSKSLNISVVIPVFNEEENIEELYRRLTNTLNMSNNPYEIIFVDDGSMDASPGLLRRLADLDDKVVVVAFNRNYGQHAAVMAGLGQSTGDVVVTMDADLQNPPEEVPRLVEKIGEGYDMVGTRRKKRKDSAFRRFSSRMMNKIMRRVLKSPMRDYGCMLRAYRRDVVDSMCQCNEISTFVPALAVKFAANSIEIRVAHNPRQGGETKYPFKNLVKLLVDLVIGFSMLPMRIMTVFGIVISIFGTGFGFFLLIRRLVIGPEVEGVFTLFSILFVFIGILFLALGLMGEYIGRIYAEVRHRPRYLIKEVYKKQQAGQDHAPPAMEKKGKL